MCNNDFTTYMKRHQRSNLCLKLYKELKDSNRLHPILQQLKNSVEEKKKAQKTFSQRKEPIYAMESIVYKGATIYVIVHNNSSYDIVFNTTPIGDSKMEFIQIGDDLQTKTIIYTQHVLDRYNQRVHRNSLKSNIDILKRLLVNNPIKSQFSIDERTKRSVAKLNEGFIWGIRDEHHQCIVVTTFYNNEARRDKKEQKIARTIYEKMTTLSSIQIAMYNALRKQLFDRAITEDEFEGLLMRHQLQID